MKPELNTQGINNLNISVAKLLDEKSQSEEENLYGAISIYELSLGLISENITDPNVLLYKNLVKQLLENRNKNSDFKTYSEIQEKLISEIFKIK